MHENNYIQYVNRDPRHGSRIALGKNKAYATRKFCVDAKVEQGIAQLSEEILRYLRTHPEAADTLDGVIEWWLPRQHRKVARERVQQALDHLIARGLVTKTILAGRHCIHVRKEAKKPDVRLDKATAKASDST